MQYAKTKAPGSKTHVFSPMNVLLNVPFSKKKKKKKQKNSSSTSFLHLFSLLEDSSNSSTTVPIDFYIPSKQQLQENKYPLPDSLSQFPDKEKWVILTNIVNMKDNISST